MSGSKGIDAFSAHQVREGVLSRSQAEADAAVKRRVLSRRTVDLDAPELRAAQARKRIFAQEKRNGHG